MADSDFQNGLYGYGVCKPRGQRLTILLEIQNNNKDIYYVTGRARAPIFRICYRICGKNLRKIFFLHKLSHKILRSIDISRF